MNILIQRVLPQAEISAFRNRFPKHEVQIILPQDPIEEHLEWAEIILSNPPPQLILDKGKHLKWIQLLSSGFDEYELFKDAPFTITTAHGVHPFIIAQHVLMMILMLERKQQYFGRRQRVHHWDRAARLPGILRNQTLGIVGFGAIAHQLVKLVKPIGLKIQAVDKFPQSHQENKDVRVEGMDCFDRLLTTSDHIVVALPSTPETRKIFNAERLRKIKQGAYFYNVARGDLVDETTLIELLKSRHLGGAALDVFEEEPLNEDSPLWDLENCIVTPHIAGHHKGLDVDVLELFGRNLERFDKGMPLLNVANFQKGY